MSPNYTSQQASSPRATSSAPSASSHAEDLAPYLVVGSSRHSLDFGAKPSQAGHTPNESRLTVSLSASRNSTCQSAIPIGQEDTKYTGTTPGAQRGTEVCCGEGTSADQVASLSKAKFGTNHLQHRRQTGSDVNHRQSSRRLPAGPHHRQEPPPTSSVQDDRLPCQSESCHRCSSVGSIYRTASTPSTPDLSGQKTGRTAATHTKLHRAGEEITGTAGEWRTTMVLFLVLHTIFLCVFVCLESIGAPVLAPLDSLFGGYVEDVKVYEKVSAVTREFCMDYFLTNDSWYSFAKNDIVFGANCRALCHVCATPLVSLVAGCILQISQNQCILRPKAKTSIPLETSEVSHPNSDLGAQSGHVASARFYLYRRRQELPRQPLFSELAEQSPHGMSSPEFLNTRYRPRRLTATGSPSSNRNDSWTLSPQSKSPTASAPVLLIERAEPQLSTQARYHEATNNHLTAAQLTSQYLPMERTSDKRMKSVHPEITETVSSRLYGSPPRVMQIVLRPPGYGQIKFYQDRSQRRQDNLLDPSFNRRKNSSMVQEAQRYPSSSRGYTAEVPSAGSNHVHTSYLHFLNTTPRSKENTTTMLMYHGNDSGSITSKPYQPFSANIRHKKLLQRPREEVT